MKTFIVTDVAGDQQSAENEESSSIKQVSAADNEDKGLETMQMIEPKLEKSLTETDDPMNIEPSNIQKNGKRLLESVKQEPNVEKKLKYESPLDFLRLPNNKYE